MSVKTLEHSLQLLHYSGLLLLTLRPVVPNSLLSYLIVVLGVFNVAVRTSHTLTN